MQNKLKEKITNNNKGYLIVEIIVSFIIVMGIAFFLIQLTSKFLSQNDDTYVETALLTDKALMASTIMNDVNSSKLVDVTEIDDSCAILVFSDNPDNIEITNIKVKKLLLANDTKTFSYGTIQNQNNYITITNGIISNVNADCSTPYDGNEYTKKLSDKLSIEKFYIDIMKDDDNTITDSQLTITDSQLTINIPAYTAYSKEDYGLKVVIPYSSKQLSYKEKYLVTLEVTNGTIEGATTSVTELIDKGNSFSKTVIRNNDINVENVTATCNRSVVSFSDNCTFIISNVTEAMKCEIVYKKLKEEIINTVPKLATGMIPVYYDNSCINGTNCWRKADISNSSNNWYDYNNKKWANVVLVSSTRRNTYNYASKGKMIKDEDILAFYVWIPRYKYKVWNINKIVSEDSYKYGSYDPYHNGIDIVFETGTSTTGTIKCNSYSYATPSLENGSPNETCFGSNGEYYTHPAFWWDNDGDGIRESNEELTGFWIGKYETSSYSYTNQTCNGTNSTSFEARILPSVKAWDYVNLRESHNVAKNMQKPSNNYGLPMNTSLIDSHVLKNVEWGAVAYLANSKYGRCSGLENGCKIVSQNTCNPSVTGCGAQTDGSLFGSNGALYYNNLLTTTTGNIYGIFDMHGGLQEIMASNFSSVIGDFEFDTQTNGFNSDWYENKNNRKYIDAYARLPVDERGSGCDYPSEIPNVSRLGDSMGETILTFLPNGSWYGSSNQFGWVCHIDSVSLARGHYWNILVLNGIEDIRGIYDYSLPSFKYSSASVYYTFRLALS